MAVYLDNNATTALDEEVLEAMLPFMGAVTGNPSSVHRFGRLQKDAIEQSRESVAQLVGARAEQVIFTSGGTEANNLLLNGFSRQVFNQSTYGQVKARRAKDAQVNDRQLLGNSRIAISSIEHMSMLEQLPQLLLSTDSISVNTDGLIELQELENAMTEQTSLVSVMAANNETGVIQNLQPLIEFAHEQGCFFHTDASQAAGKIPLNFVASGVHAMTVSAHKIYGPVGAGALIIDQQLPMSKIQFGGSQEKGLRAGTENVPAIVGFGKAAELALRDLEARSQHSRTLRDVLQNGLKQLSAVSIFAVNADRLPNTVQFGVDGFEGETLLMQLDRKAIAVSSGSACTSDKSGPSHVLKAMGISDALASSAIRVSIGKDNNMSDIEEFLAALSDIIKASQHSSVMMAASVSE